MHILTTHANICALCACPQRSTQSHTPADNTQIASTRKRPAPWDAESQVHDAEAAAADHRTLVPHERPAQSTHTHVPHEQLQQGGGQRVNTQTQQQAQPRTPRREARAAALGAARRSSPQRECCGCAAAGGRRASCALARKGGGRRGSCKHKVVARRPPCGRPFSAPATASRWLRNLLWHVCSPLTHSALFHKPTSRSRCNTRPPCSVGVIIEQYENLYSCTLYAVDCK